MFECDRDRDLIQVMGEATREESTCIAQRLLAVAELNVRHQGALADMEWCLVDYCAATAAEVSAAQNISHARAVGQVQFACALAHRLPSVAKVFLRGTIDFRMVSTVINRTDNVEDALMPEVDEAIARHCEKWMKLSRPKLQDRVDQWGPSSIPPECVSRPRSRRTGTSTSTRPAPVWHLPPVTCARPTGLR